MDESAREAQRQYLRKWRREHPDRVQQHNRTYWQRRAERLKAEKEAVKQNED